MQIEARDEELKELQHGLRLLEGCLHRSKAEKDAERQKYSARMQAVLQEKLSLQNQLNSKQSRLLSANTAKEARMKGLVQKLESTQRTKSQLEQTLADLRVCCWLVEVGHLHALLRYLASR